MSIFIDNIFIRLDNIGCLQRLKGWHLLLFGDKLYIFIIYGLNYKKIINSGTKNDSSLEFDQSLNQYYHFHNFIYLFVFKNFRLNLNKKWVSLKYYFFLSFENFTFLQKIKFM